MGIFTRKMAPSVAISTKERSAVLARMNASNTASMMDQAISSRAADEYTSAVARIREKLGDAAKKEGAGEDPALVLLGQIIDMLLKGRLTINFKAAKWFTKEITFEKYGGMFEIGYDTKNAYAKQRDQAESNMFNYGGQPGPVAADLKKYGVANIQNTGTQTEKKYVPANPNFLGGMRPKYAALDFNFASNGGAASSLYGKSFFVLHEHVKHNATFTPNDSLKETDSSRVANIHNMFPLVGRAGDAVLNNYIEVAMGRKGRSTLILPYTEAQLHSDVTFRYDIAEVHTQDLSGCSAEVKKNFQKFISKFGLKAEACPGNAADDT